MLTHHQIWSAIDSLAELNGFSASGLAKQAGLDPTTLNKSKRFTSDGKARWPSTESIAKVLQATETTLDKFVCLLSSAGNGDLKHKKPIPHISLEEAKEDGFFDDSGFPAGSGWDQVPFPNVEDQNTYALEITSDSMEPYYRQGDVLIVSPNSEIRRSDRIIVRKTNGEVLAKFLNRQTTNWIEFSSINPPHEKLKVPSNDIDWIARIVWASQ